MVKKYDIEFGIPVPQYSCGHKLTKMIYTAVAEGDDCVPIIVQAFKNMAYPRKFIRADSDKIWYTYMMKLAHLTNVDEDVKDRLCAELTTYYDKEFSLYGPQTYNTGVGGPLFNANALLMGRNKSWVYRNRYNTVMIVEKLYDDSGNRVYDASEVLKYICKV